MKLSQSLRDCVHSFVSQTAFVSNCFKGKQSICASVLSPQEKAPHSAELVGFLALLVENPLTFTVALFQAINNIVDRAGLFIRHTGNEEN